VNIQHSNTLSESEQIRQRFEEICDLLQLPEDFRPRLKIMEVDSRKNWHVFGRYSRKTNILQLSNELLSNDYLAVHELIHFVCAKTMRYHGSHGVPFLALHDLVVAYYMDNESLGDGMIIDTQWASIATSKTKTRAKEEAASIVEVTMAKLSDAGYSRERQPGLLMLATMVQQSSASTYCFAWQDTKTWLHSFDIAWTQKHGIFPMLATLIARGGLASILICVGFAELFGELKWEWLRGATLAFGSLAVCLLLLFPVYQFGVRVFVGYDLRKPEDGR
jgi:hypothetical protein